MPPRPMRMITPQGVHSVDPSDEREASTIGQHANAVQHYLRTGDTSDLNRFHGAQVGGIDLATDPDDIEVWARRGELDFDDIYEVTT